METIIQTLRLRPSDAKHTSLLAATQSDRARLIYSASFRRLQQKAQVFSLESNSAVRSRLTHSIEVSHIGRYIITSISEMLNESKTIPEQQRVFWRDNSLSLSNIVETSCLMHDIGNPPFGHFGEAAIQKWANSKETKIALENALNVQPRNQGDTEPYLYLLDDFKNFDGNPQGFRNITKLQGDDGFYGLNLTCTQLSTFLKYTHSPTTIEKNGSAPFSKKIGFFDTELNIIKKIWENLEIAEHSRHPLSFLMEASDDISYCISDIEDGIEKGIISLPHFQKNISQQLNVISIENKDKNENICKELIKSLEFNPKSSIGAFLKFKTTLSNFLVKEVAKKFVANYEKFINFEITEEIICNGMLAHKLLKMLKIYTKKYLFSSSEAECMELSGFAIISGILSEYSKLLSLTKKQFTFLLSDDYEEIKNNELHIQSRLFNRLPEKHLDAYKAAVIEGSISEIKHGFSKKLEYAEQPDVFEQEINKRFNEHLLTKLKDIDDMEEWSLRAHLLVDFVSGMTDQFSMEFYQLLKGINVKF